MLPSCNLLKALGFLASFPTGETYKDRVEEYEHERAREATEAQVAPEHVAKEAKEAAAEMQAIRDEPVFWWSFIVGLMGSIAGLLLLASIAVAFLEWLFYRLVAFLQWLLLPVFWSLSLYSLFLCCCKTK